MSAEKHAPVCMLGNFECFLIICEYLEKFIRVNTSSEEQKSPDCVIVCVIVATTGTSLVLTTRTSRKPLE